MKNIAGSRNERTGIRDSAYRLRREWSVEEERFEFRVKLRGRESQSGAGLIDAGLMRHWWDEAAWDENSRVQAGAWCVNDLSVSFELEQTEGRWRVTVSEKHALNVQQVIEIAGLLD